MLHHSNSRLQRNRGSKIKIIAQFGLLLVVVVWLLYQVKHLYDKKNEFLDDNEDAVTNEDVHFFPGRKEKAGYKKDANADNQTSNFDVLSKTEELSRDHTDGLNQQDEEKNEGTVFDKENNESQDEDITNIGNLENEQGQISKEDGDNGLHANDGDHLSGQNEDAHSHDAISGEESERTNGDVSVEESESRKDDHIIEAIALQEISGDDVNSNEDTAQDGPLTNANGNLEDGENANKKEEVDSQIASGLISDTSKNETTEDSEINRSSNDENAKTLPDENGNVPKGQNEDTQNVSSEIQGDATATTSEAVEHTTGETARNETRSVSEDAKSSGSTGEETPKKLTSESQSDNATNAIVQEASDTEKLWNGSSEEKKLEDSSSNGDTNSSHEKEQVYVKIETSTSLGDEQSGTQ